MITAPTAPKHLEHLTVVNEIFAETSDGRFYAYRPGRRHGWTLVSRDREFPPTFRRTVVECDAYLTVWLATR